MMNLLHLVVSLVEDPTAREDFRNDPDAAVADIGELTGEDVAAVIDVARIQVDPAQADALTAAMHLRSDDDGSPRRAALETLLAVCDAAEHTAN